MVGQDGPVWLLGCGMMGAQIAIEYALAGGDVHVESRDVGHAQQRLRRAAEVAASAGIVEPDVALACATNIAVVDRLLDVAPRPALVVESLPEDLELKVGAIEPVVRSHPGVVIATNTSSLSVAALGAAIGAPERTVGKHYWNPPLLMPLVELVVTADADPAVVDMVAQRLRAMHKQPVHVGDVAGFVWNRLQFSLLREAAWITEHGIATPDQVDRIVSGGLALRWAQTGPFATMTLGGAETFAAIAENLLPQLSVAQRLPRLAENLYLTEAEAGALRQRRDTALAAGLRATQETTR